MAEAKSKKPATDKKIIDVKNEGDAASGNSRQIILNNRPIMKDPMMAEVTELANAQAGIKDETPTESEAPGAPAVISRKKVIPVAHDDAEPDTPVVEKPTKVEKAEEPKKTSKAVKVAEKPEAAKPTPADTIDVAAAAEPVAEPLPANVPTEPEVTAEDADKASAVATTESPEPNTEEAKPAESASAAEPEAEEPKKESEDEPKGGGFAGERAPGAGLQPGRSFDEKDAPAAPTDDSGTDDKSESKDKKPQLQPGELTPDQQKAYDSGKYFLPIITTETRRMRLEIILAAVFIIILLAVWLDVMLDAGLLHVSGVQPITHFFKS